MNDKCEKCEYRILIAQAFDINIDESDCWVECDLNDPSYFYEKDSWVDSNIEIVEEELENEQ